MNSCHLLDPALLAGGSICTPLPSTNLLLSSSFSSTAAVPEVVSSLLLCWQMDLVNALVCFRQS